MRITKIYLWSCKRPLNQTKPVWNCNFRAVLWILAYFACWENGDKFMILSECIFMIGHVVRMKRLKVVWIIFEQNFNFAPNDRRTSLLLEYTSRKTETAIFTWIKHVMSSPSIPFMLRARRAPTTWTHGSDCRGTSKLARNHLDPCNMPLTPGQTCQLDSVAAPREEIYWMPTDFWRCKTLCECYSFNFQYWCW